MANGKGMGPDGLPANFPKLGFFGEPFGDAVSLVRHHRCYFNAWRGAVGDSPTIEALDKRDRTECDGYRAISLAAHARKVLLKIAVDRKSSVIFWPDPTYATSMRLLRCGKTAPATIREGFKMETSEIVVRFSAG